MAHTLIPGSILSLSAEVADRLLKADSGDGALLYLHLLRHGSPQGLPWPALRIEGAMGVLSRLGMAPATSTMPPPVAPSSPAELPAPTYSTEEITEALEETTSTFTAVADEVERQLGKKLNATDLKALYTLYDHLSFPPEVILLLVTYCIEEHQRKYGTGRRPYLSAIRREGFIWARRGIETMESAEEFLQKQTILRSREGGILQALDIAPRPLVSREQSYIEDWQTMGFDDETIRLAYEKTVMKKGAMEWAYLNGILRRWHEKGLHSVDTITASDRTLPIRAGQNGIPAPQTQQVSQQTQDRAKEDMDRMRRIIDQMNREEG